jgi:hypothetical protein
MTAFQPAETMRSALATILGVAILAIVLAPGSALADGDPASDVLIGENVYYPYSPAVSTSLQKRLNGETAAVARAHFPIKVALIPTPADLGAIRTLFDKPQQYAHFLEQEISFLNVKPLLLVVMPDGYGAQHLGSAATRAVASLSEPASAQGNDLARAAIAAVPKLAAAAGHRVANVSGPATPGGTSPVLPAAILAAAAIAGAASVLLVRSPRASAIRRRKRAARESRSGRG